MKMIHDNEDAIKIANAAFEWCKRVFEVKQTEFDVKIVVSFDKRVKRMYGHYSNGVIYVYPSLCRSRKRLIETVLHEYKHFMQMPYANSMINYFALNVHFDYVSHPYEIEANEFAKKEYKRCYASLQRKKIL